MSIEVISYPQREVNENVNTISKWSAVHHPIKFQMQRADYDVTLGTIAGNAYIQFSSVYVPSIVDFGDTISFKSDTCSGTMTVTSFTSSLVNGTITSLTGTYGGVGLANLNTRLNYFVITNIWGIDQSNNYYLIGQSINKPDAFGLVTVDVSSFLKSIVDYVDFFNYDALNERDLTLGNKYNISYSENWNGFEGVFSGLSSTLVRYFTNSSKQIQDLYGSNMGVYVPFNNYDAQDTRAKFLSDFAEPTYFPGFPFSLSFIYSDGLVGTQTIKHEERFDINGGSINSQADELDNAESQYVNRLMITQGYASNVKELDVWLENGDVESCIQYVADGYVIAGYVEELCGFQTIPPPPPIL